MTTELPRATILVVEDRSDVLDLVTRALGEAGHAVLTAPDVERGLAVAAASAPDLVILDLMLPGGDGLDVARTLRRTGFRAPILMLTGRGTLDDRVDGLDAGGDDYLTKPFELDELLARVRALLRRAAFPTGRTELRVGDLVLDPTGRRLVRAGEPINLTLKETGLLELLMRQAGRPVSREEAMQVVWRAESDVTTNIVDVYVNYLRKKLDGESAPSRIRTVRGVGYELRID